LNIVSRFKIQGHCIRRISARHSHNAEKRKIRDEEYEEREREREREEEERVEGRERARGSIRVLYRVHLRERE
jgi:hypothetical protein